MVTLVIIKIVALFNNHIYTGNYGNLGNLLGCEWCMLGRSDEQDIDYYGNLGNSGNFESRELTLQNPNKGYVKLALRPRDCL